MGANFGFLPSLLNNKCPTGLWLLMTLWCKSCQEIWEIVRLIWLFPAYLLVLRFIFHLMDWNHRLRAGPLQRICHWSSLLNFEARFGGMVLKFRKEDHALFISCAHAILPQISRRVGHKISLRGLAGSDAWTDPLNYRANLRRNGGPYRAKCTGQDHVHMFLSIPPKLALSNVMQGPVAL